MKRRRDIVYSFFTKEMLREKYQLGTFDCLQLIKRLGREKGLDVPESFQGITWENYTEIWEEDQVRAKKLVIDFLLYIGKEVSLNQIQTGDILVYELVKNEISIGIYIGDKVFSIYSDVGARSIKRTSFLNILKIIRWEK